MSGGQVIRQVEWPLALPLVISGVRSATLQVVATATIAAYSSGTGLGRLLVSGNANRNYLPNVCRRPYRRSAGDRLGRGLGVPRLAERATAACTQQDSWSRARRVDIAWSDGRDIPASRWSRQ